MKKEVKVNDAIIKSVHKASKALETALSGKSVPTLEERHEALMKVNQKLIHVIQAERYERQQADLKASLKVNQRNVVQRVLAALRGN